MKASAIKHSVVVAWLFTVSIIMSVIFWLNSLQTESVTNNTLLGVSAISLILGLVSTIVYRMKQGFVVNISLTIMFGLVLILMSEMMFDVVRVQILLLILGSVIIIYLVNIIEQVINFELRSAKFALFDASIFGFKLERLLLLLIYLEFIVTSGEELGIIPTLIFSIKYLCIFYIVPMTTFETLNLLIKASKITWNYSNHKVIS